MKLYDFPESANAWKIKLILNLLQIPAEIIRMDGLKGATRTETFKKKNVDQRLPLLELDDGRFIAESNAILYFLAQGTPLWSEDPFEQTEILRWMFFEQNRIEAAVAVKRFILQHVPGARQDKAFLNALHPRALQALQVMDDHLENHDFFAANRFTIADIALYAYSHVAGEADIGLAAFPNILKWITRVEERERFVPFAGR